MMSFALRNRRAPSISVCSASSLKTWLRHPYDVISNPIGILLVHITWLTDGELRLDHARTKQPLGREISCGLTESIEETLVIFF